MSDLNRLKIESLTNAKKEVLCKSIRGRISAARNIEPGSFPEVLRFAMGVQQTLRDVRQIEKTGQEQDGD